MKKRKILIENDFISGGGAEQIMKVLVDRLTAEGYDVTVAIHRGNRREFYRRYPRRVTFQLLEFPWRDSVKRFTFPWILQRIRYTVFSASRFFFDRKRFDVAVAMKEGPCMQDVALRKAASRYGWVHVDYRYQYWTKTVFLSAAEEAECFRKMDRVICVSQAAADGVAETIGDPGNLAVCYNPINVEEIHRQAAETCPVCRKKDRPLFVAVGRLAKEKQYDMLVEACARLAEGYAFELWIIGDGPERERLEKMVERRNLSCVKLLGGQENPYPYVTQADYFVSASLAESYGLAIQEALILGVPVIVTECPAMWETIPEGSGLIVPNQAEALFQSMASVLNTSGGREPFQTAVNAGKSPEEWYEARLDTICHILEC